MLVLVWLESSHIHRLSDMKMLSLQAACYQTIFSKQLGRPYCCLVMCRSDCDVISDNLRFWLHQHLLFPDIDLNLEGHALNFKEYGYSAVISLAEREQLSCCLRLARLAGVGMGTSTIIQTVITGTMWEFETCWSILSCTVSCTASSLLSRIHSCIFLTSVNCSFCITLSSLQVYSHFTRPRSACLPCFLVVRQSPLVQLFCRLHC